MLTPHGLPYRVAMARSPLLAGQRGKVSFTTLTNGQVRARARLCLPDLDSGPKRIGGRDIYQPGPLVQVEATGPDEDAALAELDRVEAARLGRQLAEHEGTDMDGDDLPAELRRASFASFAMWVVDKRAGDDLAETSAAIYRTAIIRYLAHSPLGKLQVAKVDTSRVHEYLQDVLLAVGMPTARQHRTILSLVAKHAIAAGLRQSNPVTDAPRLSALKTPIGDRARAERATAIRAARRRLGQSEDATPRRTQRRLDTSYLLVDGDGRDERAKLAMAVARDERAKPPTFELLPDATAGRGERKTSGSTGLDLRDLVMTCLGSGVRIGEVLGLTWADVPCVQMDAATWRRQADAELRISGAVRTIKGQGSQRGETKNRKGLRTVFVHRRIGALLRRRYRRALEFGHAAPEAPVFGTPGRWPGQPPTLRDRSNLSKRLRELFDRCGYPEVSIHTFRRTNSTLIADAAGLDVAADVLGHDPRTAKAHYARVLANRRKAAATIM